MGGLLDLGKGKSSKSKEPPSVEKHVQTILLTIVSAGIMGLLALAFNNQTSITANGKEIVKLTVKVEQDKEDISRRLNVLETFANSFRGPDRSREH